AGATAMLVFHFDAELAGTSAEDFIARILIQRLGAHGVVTGADFTFGRQAKGNVALLRGFGGELGLQSRVVEAVADGDEVVSSSRIREALRAGDPQLAARLLTRPFAIRGIVEHGDKRGRTIGYPTANLSLEHYLRPRYGIYAVTGRILATGEVLKGAANIGIRPQFTPPRELLEPHFFDFSGDLYGQEIEVAFHHYLRGEARFDSLEALIAQMDKDCAEARRLLSAQPL
ncbi:MAG: riboflavin biosynthesis protein RibF, partial [Erythrobacter cryptus]